jgi:hypothetical protein
VRRLAMAPTMVTSSPSRIQTVPRPITTSRPLCLPCSVTRLEAEQTTAPVGWDG